jgi:uncharacterized protein YcbX
VVTVQQLQVAPVKGLAMVRRAEIHLDADGVAEDRRVLLLHADGSVVTMRRLPTLVRVRPELDLVAGTLSVTLPDGSTAVSPLDAVGGRVGTRLFGKERVGRLLPGNVADALSAHVGEPLRVLVAEGAGVGVDEGPVSIVSRASAAAVDSPDDGSGLPRFRMLIEVDGDEPFVEDGWVGRRLRIGEAAVDVSHNLSRCLVIHHHPVTGEKDWAGLRALASHRGPDRLTLGVIAVVASAGTVRVGDAVHVD